MTVNTKAVIVFAVLVKTVLGTNVLFVSPVASPSHHVWNKALVAGLLEKGYNVTMLTHETERAPLPNNLTLITMEGMYELIYGMFNIDDYADQAILPSMKMMWDFTLFSCAYDYNTTGFKTLLNYPKDFRFHIIIFDATLSRCYFPIIERFNNPPAVSVTPFLLPPFLSIAYGNPLYPSYVPYYNLAYTNDMSFTERVFNFIYTYAEILYRNYVHLPNEEELAKKSFDQHILSLDELERNISLLLSNTDPVLDYPLALPPNIIPVGGLHARPANPLPKDLKDVMDKAKDGVIVFSLGTNVRSDQLKPTVRQAFLDAFAKLSQVIIWKFESNITEELPQNVVIRNWLPLNDVLGHPNTKLFISHGGALSTQEAMYHGVPVIGIPYYGDQHLNIHKMEKKQLAKRLDRQRLTFKVIYDTIQDVLNSETYKNNMHLVSKLYRDQPQTALQRGIFWIEYVLHHGSAEHLVLPARDMPAYQTANLDVLAVFVVGLILIYSVFSLLLSGVRFIISMRHYDTKAKPTK